MLNESDLTLALRLADLADAITLGYFRAHDLAVETKPDHTPVTEADRAVELMVREQLAQHRASDALLGEEFGITGDIHGRCWVVDPIDGTKNYLRGVPVWATLIALVDGGRPVLGVVAAPAMGRRWWANNETAFTRDVDGTVRQLQVSQVKHWQDASLAYSDRVGWPEGAFDHLCDGIWRTRGYGDFYSHMLVAEGAVDIAVEPDLGVWDVAALVPIITAAGGSVTGLGGHPLLRWQSTDGNPASVSVPAGMLSSNRLLHAQACQRIARAATYRD